MESEQRHLPAEGQRGAQAVPDQLHLQRRLGLRLHVSRRHLRRHGQALQPDGRLPGRLGREGLRRALLPQGLPERALPDHLHRRPAERHAERLHPRLPRHQHPGDVLPLRLQPSHALGRPEAAVLQFGI